MDKCIM